MTEDSWKNIRNKKSKWISFRDILDANDEIMYLDEWGIDFLRKKWDILEVGFGYNRFLKSLVEIKGIPKSYTGIEINPFWVEEAKKAFCEYPNFVFVEGDLTEKSSYTGLGTFDLIIALETFAYLKPTFEEALVLFKNTIRKEGYLCFSVIERPKVKERIVRENKLFERSYDPEEVKEILEKMGWMIQEKRKISYRKGQHVRAFYLCRKEGTKITPKRKKVDPSNKIGIFIDSLSRVTGGHKRRVNMAKELTKRDWDVSFIVSTFKKSNLWRGIDFDIPQEKARANLGKEFVFMGDHRWNFKEFLRANGTKVWMYQGMRVHPNKSLEQTFRNPQVVALCFSTWFKELVENKWKRYAYLAPGGVDPKFFYPDPTEEREQRILTSKYHYVLPKDKKRELEQFIKSKGWKIEILVGNEENIRKQYWKSGFAMSLRGDIEGTIYRDWNNPIAEAMATKTPSLLFKTGGTGDIAYHMKTAYVVPLNNSLGRMPNIDLEKLKEGIEWMIENKEKREEMAEKAYEHIQDFSYEKMVDKIEKEILNNDRLYRSLEEDKE